MTALILLALIAVHLAVIFAHPALLLALFAAVAATATDLAPLVNGVIMPLLQPVIAAALLWLVYKVASLFHFNIQAGQRALLETAIANGLSYAAGKVAALPISVNPQQATVAAVASYVAQTAPGALKSLGLDKDAAALAAAITARLPSGAPTPPAP